jgi:hypothetical protein
MRYEVSERFYNTASSLIALALDDENSTEYDIAIDLIRDLVIKE